MNVDWIRPLAEHALQVVDLFRDHWPSVGLSVLWLVVGLWWGRRRALRAWRKKEFLDRLNVSLNLIEDGTLLIRTMLETSLDAVLLNKVASEKVLAASRKTTPEQPLLPLAKDEAWFLLNAVLNLVAERFSPGEIVRDAAGVDATIRKPKKIKYLLCLTCEAYGESRRLRTRKIRAMMLRRELLLNLPDEPPRFEHPHHSQRWDTLKSLAAAYPQQPEAFIELELCLPPLAVGSQPAPTPAVASDIATAPTS